MDILIFILVIAGVAALIFFALRSKKARADKRNLNRLPITLPAEFPHRYNADATDAPYISSVVPVPQEALDAIKQGIMMQIRATQALYPHWDKVRSPYDYNVMLIEPDAETMEGFPALYYQVKNAEMQVIDRIKTAGTVIGTGSDGISPTNIVLPHQGHKNWQYLDYLRDASRFESEHFAELFNDMEMFRRFATSGDVHPHHLLPEESGNLVSEAPMRAVGFASTSRKTACVEITGNEKPQEGRNVYIWMDEEDYS